MATDKTKPITDEIATVEKDIFMDYIGKTLINPDKVIKSESGGKGIELYEDLLTDDQVGSNLQTRKLAVVGKEWEVVPATDKPQDQKIADYVKQVLLSCNYDAARKTLLSGIVMGFKPAEIMWKYSEGDVWIDQIIGKASRRFVFDTNRRMRLLTLGNMVEGEELPDRKFVVYTNISDNGSPYGDGLGRLLYWPVWFKKNAIKFWMIFADKFGSPTVLGKYPTGTLKSEQDVLLDACAAIQQESAIKIPDTMEIGFLEATRGGNVNTYESLCKFMNAAISKAILGQTLTTEVGDKGSYAASKTHEDVRGDYTKADADSLCECQNSSLVKWVVDYNFPGVKQYPKVWVRTEEEGDLKPLAERDKILVVDIGVPIGRKYFYDTYGIPEPEEGEELIKQAASSTPTVSKDQIKKEQAFSEDNASELDRAIAAQGKIDSRVDYYVAASTQIFESMTNAIVSFLETTPDMETASDALPDLYKKIDTTYLARLIAESLSEADAIGSSSVKGSVSFAQWGVGLPFREAMDFFKAQGMTIANTTKADLLGEMKGAIRRSMETGSTLESFRKEARSIYESAGYTALAPHHIDTIYRTNMQSAYQAGRYKQMTDPAVIAARPYWRYVSVMDGRTRPPHAAMNGKIYRYDDPIWQSWYPPNGFNCRCTVVTVSGSEMTREGWKVEKDPPAGWPDEGFGERTGSLADLLDAGNKQDLVWKERQGQSGPKDLGRPLEKSIPDMFWRPSPGKVASLEELISREGMIRTAAIDTIETEYRQVMGISPNEMYAALRDPLDEVVKVDLTGLAHAMINRADRRERYIRYFRDTIEKPYEILLTEYEAGVTGKTKYRKKYIGLYQEKSQEAVVIVAETTKDGSIMWNVMNAKKGTIDRIRNGVEVLYGE